VLIEHDGKRPSVAESAYVAPNAVVAGDVTIADDVRVLFGAIITADGGPVRIGRQTIVMEHALVRGRQGYPAELGECVLVGPEAHLNGAIVEDYAFLATGVSVFPGARIGRCAEVRIHGVVHVNSRLPAETVVPIGWVAVGDPAQVFPPSRHDDIASIQRGLNFVGTAYGIEPSDDLASEMRQITQGYAELFGRHKGDRVLDDDLGVAR
jgi:carbonic anhydrase/acetyltransferase-like protein (isoleucine patch superfamily)